MKFESALFKVVPETDHPRKAVMNLKEKFGAACIKLSTEDAGMSMEQIDWWTRMFDGVLPVVVKIGGPNARNDIKQVINMGVSGLIAPMVESPYGLENFIEAVKSYATPEQYENIGKHINIETATALGQLEEILGSPFMAEVDEITIGCSDLSRSMKKKISDPHFLRQVKETVKRIKSKSVKVSVGGGISPSTIDTYLGAISPDKFNTRIVTFEVQNGWTYKEAVQKALEFEMLMLTEDRSMGFITPEEETLRTRELRKRMD